MSTSCLYPWGEVETSIPVGEKLAISVDSGKVEVYEVVGYPDMPTSEKLLATVDDYAVLGTYSAVKTVILRNSEALARYEIGTAPSAVPYVAGVNQHYMRRQPASVAKTDTVTLTVANILTGYIAGTPTAAAVYTLPTGAELSAGLEAIGLNLDSAADTAIDFTINNAATDAAYTITLAAGATGWGTSIGNLIVSAYSAAAAASTARFALRNTAADSWQIMRIS
jgi:hypothetical protein